MNAPSVHTAPCILSSEQHPSFMPSVAEETPPHRLFSKADFFHAIEMLAGEPGVAEFVDDMEAVVVAWPLDAWKQAFGEPRNLRIYRGIVSDPPLEVWEQRCSDGVVHCVGYFVDDPHDGQRVVVTRVCLF